MMDFTEKLIKDTAKKVNSLNIVYEGNEIDLNLPFQRKSMLELFAEFMGKDIELINSIRKSTF